MQALDLEAYERLKGRLLSTTAALAVGGSAVAGVASGPNAAFAFAVGGLVSHSSSLFLYVWSGCPVGDSCCSESVSMTEHLPPHPHPPY